jgi:hypothetical protein
LYHVEIKSMKTYTMGGSAAKVLTVLLVLSRRLLL